MKPKLPIPNHQAGAPSSGSFDLGTWLGRRQAFGMMAGRTAAADAECLRQIRDQKLYKSETSSWAEFCERYIGTSRTHVDSVIRHLEQFGQQFFELTQFTRIPPEAYRAIASHVTAEGVHLDGEVIPLKQENSLRIAGAVLELRKRSTSAKEHSAAASEPGFPAVEKRFEDLIARLAALRLPLSAAQEKALARLVLRLLEHASVAGVQLHLT
jgi:uncharacterized tellurite resistance protein B-like protein